MAITPIDVVIDPPLPTDAPSIFDQKAFAAWAAINGWATQANALAVQVNTDADRVNDPSVQAVADNIADVMAVAGIEANVTIVATNSANVTAVAGNAPNINAVAGNATNINAVNANKVNIDIVAAIDDDVDTVAGIAANVMAVAAIDDEVTAVAGNATNINAVHANKANIDAVAGNATNINAVNANKTNIDAVKNNTTNINAVAGNKANIDTVAGKAADVTTVATNSANVTTVATNITAVNTAATNMAAIIAAPGAASTASSAASTATTKAGEASDSALAAAGSASTASTKAGEASNDAERAEQAAEDADNILQQVQAYGNGWTPVLAMASDGERRVVQVTDWTGGQGTKPATGYIGPSGIVADIASALDVRGAPGDGAVSSVAMSAPTGFSVSGSPVTSSGTLALSFASGYSLPTTAKQSQWDTAYGWGNHASAGYAVASNLATVATSGSYNDLSDKPSIPPGTVTSVGMSVPTGLSVSGSPVTGSGTLAMTFAAGYAIPTTAKQGQWDTAYGWGNHSSAGYALSSSLGTAAAKNAPTSGNASSSEVVLGSDTRLTDARTPTSHTHTTANITGLDTALSDKAPLASPTFTGTVTLPNTNGSDTTLTRVMLKDYGVKYYNSNTTSTLNYVNGSHQRWAPTGSTTLSVKNWPPSGNLGELLIEGVNLGGATIAWPTVNWVKSDGTTSTTFADTEVELNTSGVDFILLWTRDAGATIYGKVMR